MTLHALFEIDPASLVSARELCHCACQWPSKAARANLTGLADDSHSNLGWDGSQQALVSHPLDAAGRIQLGFSFATQSLIWIVADAVEDQLNLVGSDAGSVQNWVDAHLQSAGLLSTANVAMPYQLHEPADFHAFSRLGAESEALGRWYAQGQDALDQLVNEHKAVAIHEPLVRCWPHHFDLATLFLLDEGDPETARSIGVGLSPGDDNYPYPYFYCTPWPAPAVGALPAPTELLRWHTEGFVSLVCRSSELDPESELTSVLTNAFALARQVV